MRLLTIAVCLVAGYLANKAVDLWGVDQGVEIIVTLQAIQIAIIYEKTRIQR